MGFCHIYFCLNFLISLIFLLLFSSILDIILAWHVSYESDNRVNNFFICGLPELLGYAYSWNREFFFLLFRFVDPEVVFILRVYIMCREEIK